MRDARQPRILFFVIRFWRNSVGRFTIIRWFPITVASHFALSGAANASDVEAGILCLHAGAGFTGSVPRGVLRTARSLAKSPTSSMNLPNKEYWLAPERRGKHHRLFEEAIRVGMVAAFLCAGGVRDGNGDPGQYES